MLFIKSFYAKKILQKDMLVFMAQNVLRTIRTELGVSQEILARRTRTVSIGTVKNAEAGKRVTYDSATQLLEAINTLRGERGMAPLRLEDLDLTIY